MCVGFGVGWGAGVDVGVVGGWVWRGRIARGRRAVLPLLGGFVFICG